MAEIIEHSHRETRSERVRDYEWVEMPDAGFSFKADKNGDPLRTEGNAANYDMLATWIAEGKLRDLGVQVHSWSYRVSATLRCDCGGEVQLEGFTNTCDHCHRDYNSYGHLLAPREQWGEATGEYLGDILRIP